jgi:hypothetical protein
VDRLSIYFLHAVHTYILTRIPVCIHELLFISFRLFGKKTLTLGSFSIKDWAIYSGLNRAVQVARGMAPFPVVWTRTYAADHAGPVSIVFFADICVSPFFCYVLSCVLYFRLRVMRILFPDRSSILKAQLFSWGVYRPIMLRDALLLYYSVVV